MPYAHGRRAAAPARRSQDDAPRGGAGVATGSQRVSRQGFPERASAELANAQLRHNLGRASRTIRAKRASVVAEVDDWEALRDAGAAIKARAMATLPEQLERLEAAVTAAGGHVHWARDAAEANSHVVEVAQAHRVEEVVKVKSIATDEIGLNAALAA